MIPEGFKEFFTSCDYGKQQRMVNELLVLADGRQEVDVPKDIKAVDCPHCKSGHITANGRLKGVQRYRCKDCGKNFSETTGKFWYNIQKRDKVSLYMHCLLSGMSIRKSAKECNISIQTSFDWRHKLLTSFNGVSPDGFKGIVESDDLFFPYSEKGKRDLERPARKRGQKASTAGASEEKVAVIATCDRSGNKDFQVATRGRISKKDISNALNGKMEKANVLCSDAHRSYGAYVKSTHLEHKKFIASKGQRTVEKVYHVQNVNNMDKRLKDFMRPFNGVATKYLQNYLNWFLVLEKIKNNTNKMKLVATIALVSN